MPENNNRPEKFVATIPAARAFGPLSESECPLVRN
jgi:hypothetical protein